MPFFIRKLDKTVFFIGVLLGLAWLGGCQPSAQETFQGYIEGEFVYVSSSLSGELDALLVQRGELVKKDQQLFNLECGAEMALQTLAAKRLEEGQAHLEDEKKGKRPEEIQSLEEQLRQGIAALEFSQKDLARKQLLLKKNVITEQDVDLARSNRDTDQHRVLQLDEDLKTAKLGSRSDQILGAESNVQALQASLVKADWDLAQKRQNAPSGGLVFDTLYRQGEWVANGQPVVVLLPPANIKVRTFVPETIIGKIHQGDAILVSVDGLPEPLKATVSFVSPQAEYNPPVIFSKENRSKMMFMIEAIFTPEVAARLHPGQPVDVKFSQLAK